MHLWTNCNYMGTRHIYVQCAVHSFHTAHLICVFHQNDVFLITCVSMNAEIIFKIHSLTGSLIYWQCAPRSVMNCAILTRVHSSIQVLFILFFFFLFFFFFCCSCIRSFREFIKASQVFSVRCTFLYVLSMLIEF